MHTHNPRVGSDLRNYLLLRDNLSMQAFCFLPPATTSGKEKNVDSSWIFSYKGCMKMTEEEDYIEEALRNRKNENALNNRLGFPSHQLM